MLLDPEWLQAKLAATDVASLTADFDYQPNDECVRLVQGAIRLSSNVIARDPRQFASQIVGRLVLYRDLPSIAEFTRRVAEGTQGIWLRALQPALDPPGTALIRTLTGHISSVHAVAVTPDGQRAVSGSNDDTLKVWDLGSGRALRTVAGHRKCVSAVAVTPDGQRVVSTSQDQTRKVWELAASKRALAAT